MALHAPRFCFFLSWCECEECGYTLFIAAGREGKFFGDSYKCPECGAPKSKFKIDEAPSA